MILKKLQAFLRKAASEALAAFAFVLEFLHFKQFNQGIRGQQ